MDVLLWTLAFVGHLGSWCVIYNRTHATSWPRKVRKRCEKGVILAVIFPFFWFGGRMLGKGIFSFFEAANHSGVEWLYLFFSAGMGVFFILRWCWRKFQKPPAVLLSQSQQLVDVQRELGRNVYQLGIGKFLKKIPFNQCHLIALESIEIAVKRLPKELDGLRICHLSDFHLTGQIDVAYFQRVAAAANRFEPDLIVVTGDLIDEYECLSWIAEVYGSLNAKHGVHFVRGNHDLRIRDQEMLLDQLRASGMKWIGGGQWHSIDINGFTVCLAGNELPWHAGAEKLINDAAPEDGLRILLTHSPDQISWAADYDFDLIFAGHTHGGQVAIPVVGPIVAPSKHGVLYASGTFEIGDAVMHVSRGLSGDESIRINCPPEIGLITLRCGEDS